MIDQREIARKLKLEKLEYGDFSYSDISQMLSIKTGSLYNFLNGQYNLSQTKAKMLRDWLNDRD